MNIRSLFTVTIALTFASLAQAASMGNAAVGKVVAEDPAKCHSCHGSAGAKPISPDYPVLAGQNYDYLVVAMEQYKTRKRKNEIMSSVGAAMYTLKDINDIAAYYATQPSPLKMKY